MDVVQTAYNSIDTIWTVVQIVIVALVFLVVFTVTYVLIKYKHKVRVRECVGGKTLIIDDKARELKDNEGVMKWKLFKRKHCLPPPPKEAIHLTNKGKYSVEVYYLPEGEYKYVLDNGVNTASLTNFEPLDTSDREFYASEMREAETYKQKNWKDLILPVAGMVSILAVLILMLVFWEDIAKPSITIVDKASAIASYQQQTAEILRDIIQNRQTIPDLPIFQGNGTG